MERRIYFRSLLVERGHVMDRGDRQNFLDGSRQPARLRRTRFIASRLALDNEAARRGGFGAHRDRVLRHCQHRRHKALHIVRAVQVNDPVGQANVAPIQLDRCGAQGPALNARAAIPDYTQPGTILHAVLRQGQSCEGPPYMRVASSASKKNLIARKLIFPAE
jgi:hypothetical protein